MAGAKDKSGFVFAVEDAAAAAFARWDAAVAAMAEFAMVAGAADGGGAGILGTDGADGIKKPKGQSYKEVTL